MNQELSTNPFNPVAPVKTFDEIKISLASPERGFCLGHMVRLRSPKLSTTARSNPNVTAYFVRVSLVRSKITNACAANINA